MSALLAAPIPPSTSTRSTAAGRDDLYAYVATLLRDRAAAEDVTAAAFERAYRRRRGAGTRLHRAALALVAAPAELEEVAAGVARVTDTAGGYVARSTVEAAPEDGTANFELRVPTVRLTQVLADLSELASVRSRSQSSVDITRTVRSAAERIEEHRAERRGLLRRLAQDPTPELRARLRFVSSRLRAAKADLASAERRADLARVSVSVQGDPDAGAAGGTGDGRWTPGDAVRDAGRVL